MTRRRDPRVPLSDIEMTAKKIAGFIDGMDVGAFRGDEMRQYAVERGFVILAAALERLGQYSPVIAARLPLPGDIAGLCHQLLRSGEQGDTQLVWSAATNDLPQLRQAAQSLLGELDRAADAPPWGLFPRDEKDKEDDGPDGPAEPEPGPESSPSPGP